MSNNGSGSAKRGGPVCEGMAGTFQHDAPLRYQSNARELANRSEDFRQLVAEIARSLRPYAITARERSRCDEVIRGRSLSHDGLMTLLDLAARSDSPMVWEEFCRSEGMKRLANPPVPCPFEASHAEQESNELLNAAQLKAHQDKTLVRWEAVIQFGQQQVLATRRLVDAATLHIARRSA